MLTIIQTSSYLRKVIKAVSCENMNVCDNVSMIYPEMVWCSTATIVLIATWLGAVGQMSTKGTA